MDNPIKTLRSRKSIGDVMIFLLILIAVVALLLLMRAFWN